MKIHQLKAFAAVADCRSFNEAARLLSVSQPAVAKAIRELEVWAGRQLVIRSSRGTLLTPDGESLLRQVRGILDQVARVEAEYSDVGPREHVSLGVSPSASVAITPSLVEFKRRNPNTGWTVLSGARRSLFEKLYDNTLDLVIATLPDNLEEMGMGLRFEPLLHLPTVLTVALGDPLEKATSLADMVHAEWLFAESEYSFNHHFRAAFAEAGIESLPAFTRCESIFLVLALAARPNTVTMWTGRAPHTYAQFESVGNLAVLTLREQLPTITVCLVHRSDLIITPVVQRLLDQIRRVKDKAVRP